MSISKNKTVAVQVIGGDPFLFYFFINNFFQKWYYLIDKLYIQLNVLDGYIIGKNPILKQFFYDICRNDPKVIISEHSCAPYDFKYKNFNFDWYPKNGQTWTGACMRHVVDVSMEDIIFFTHDDCFILDPLVFENHINLIKSEKRDMVLVAGGLLHNKFANLALEQYPFIKDKISENLEFEHFKQCVGLTTAYFIANKKDLLNTKLNFDCWNTDITPHSFYGLDYLVKKEDGVMFLEYGHDILFQLYKNGKINPYIHSEEGSGFINSLEGFKNSFDDIYKKKRSIGHIHLSGGAWSFVIHCSNLDEYVTSIWNTKNIENVEYHYYNCIRVHEKHICMLLSFMSMFDTEKYPYMKDFVKQTYDRINILISKLNILSRDINYTKNWFDNIENHITLCNNKLPYEINIDKLPTEKFNKLYI